MSVEEVQVQSDSAARATADAFGLKDGHVGVLVTLRFARAWPQLGDGAVSCVAGKVRTWAIPMPGGDRELVYAPLGTPEADAYIDDMAMGANFATVNHLLINALVLEAFQEVLPRCSW